MSRKAVRRRHIPQRTCVGCREILPKRSMIRIVRLETGISIDLTGKISGRGAYLHDRLSCWENGLKGSLAKALKTELSAADREILTAYMGNLTNEERN